MRSNAIFFVPFYSLVFDQFRVWKQFFNRRSIQDYEENITNIEKSRWSYTIIDQNWITEICAESICVISVFIRDLRWTENLKKCHRSMGSFRSSPALKISFSCITTDVPGAVNFRVFTTTHCFEAILQLSNYFASCCIKKDCFKLSYIYLTAETDIVIHIWVPQLWATDKFHHFGYISLVH
jgi:hypothetical protein